MRGCSDVWVGGFPLLHFFNFSAVFPHFIAYLVDFIEDLIDMGSILLRSGRFVKRERTCGS